MLIQWEKSEINTTPFLNLLKNCGIRVTRMQRGLRFSSLQARFASFTVRSEVERFTYEQEIYQLKGLTAHFPGTAVLLQFVGGSILLAFPSGHIRWITELGFRYYAILCRGTRPDYCQGDLVIFQLADAEILPHKYMLENMLPEDQGTVWCRTELADPKSVGNWLEIEEINVGGNGRHKALGRVKYCIPISGDYRTMQIHTLDQVFIKHYPLDHIHPPVYLSPNQHFLISKMPGFSDPAIEMARCEEVSP